MKESGSPQDLAKQPCMVHPRLEHLPLGPVVSKDDLHLPKFKLPTLKVVLRVLMYLATEETDTGNRSYFDCAKVLFPKIEALFGVDGIPYSPLEPIQSSRN